MGVFAWAIAFFLFVKVDNTIAHGLKADGGKNL
jgi:hypothetical protein